MKNEVELKLASIHSPGEMASVEEVRDNEVEVKKINGERCPKNTLITSLFCTCGKIYPIILHILKIFSGLKLVTFTNIFKI